MVEMIEQIEQAAFYFAPKVLYVPGLICLGAGILLWLGGMKWRTLTAVLAGTAAGGIGAFFFLKGDINLTLVAATVSALLAIVFRKAVITVIGAMLIASMVLLGGACKNEVDMSGWPLAENDAAMSIAESMTAAKSIAVFTCEHIADTIKNTSSGRFTFSMIVGLIIMVIGFFLPEVVGAVAFSISGTCMIFTGMILLLLYKGAKPASYIYEKSNFFIIVFLGMVVFGLLCELLICLPPKEKIIPKPVDNGEIK